MCAHWVTGQHGLTSPAWPHWPDPHAPIGANINAVSTEAHGNGPQIRPAGAALFLTRVNSVLMLASCATILPCAKLHILLPTRYLLVPGETEGTICPVFKQ